MGEDREGDRRDGRLIDKQRELFYRVTGGALSDSGHRIPVPAYPADLRTALQ
jgi:hypothetical protein